MKGKELDEKMINRIMDRNKVTGKKEFDYVELKFKRFKVNLFSYGILVLAFAFFPMIFESDVHGIFMLLLIVLVSGGIYQGVRLFLMNKKLNALRTKWMNIYMSFFWMVFAVLYLALMILLICIAPDSELLAMIKICIFLVIFIKTANLLIFLWFYADPVCEILSNLHNLEDDYFCQKRYNSFI